MASETSNLIFDFSPVQEKERSTPMRIFFFVFYTDSRWDPLDPFFVSSITKNLKIRIWVLLWSLSRWSIRGQVCRRTNYKMICIWGARIPWIVQRPWINCFYDLSFWELCRLLFLSGKICKTFFDIKFIWRRLPSDLFT